MINCCIWGEVQTEVHFFAYGDPIILHHLLKRVSSSLSGWDCIEFRDQLGDNGDCNNIKPSDP